MPYVIDKGSTDSCARLQCVWRRSYIGTLKLTPGQLSFRTDAEISEGGDATPISNSAPSGDMDINIWVQRDRR